MMRLAFRCAVMLAGIPMIPTAFSGETATVTLRVTGLFSPDRETDLRQVVTALEVVKIGRFDFESAEVSFVFEKDEERFQGADENKVQSLIDNLLKGGSNQTFGALIPTGLPKDKLERVEIPVAGLDCKACSYAAYRAIYQIEGVVRATASFEEGLVTALIETGKTNRAALEEALRQRGVEVGETGDSADKKSD